MPATELAALSERVQFAAIGSDHRAALREAGVRVAIEANDASAAGLADAIAKYYQRQQHRPRETYDISNPSPAAIAPHRGIARIRARDAPDASGFVYPMFACPGTNVRKEVSSMPGIYQQSVDQIVEECREVAGLGIPARDFVRPAGAQGRDGHRKPLLRTARCSGRLKRFARPS